jgi:hypothetical protein
MFDRRVIELATKDRVTTGHLVGEVVATAGLIALIFGFALALYPDVDRTAGDAVVPHPTKSQA